MLLIFLTLCYLEYILEYLYIGNIADVNKINACFFFPL